MEEIRQLVESMTDEAGMVDAAALLEALAEMEANMLPPQANTISVPVVYQPAIMLCSSGLAWKVLPYCQE